MRMKLCGYAGCNKLTQNKYYCDYHQQQQQDKRKKLFAGTQRKQSAPYNHLYRTATWRRLRAEHLERQPFCVICGNPADIVDHITPHRGNMDLFTNPYNLQSLCRKCHGAKTLKENNYFHKK